MGKIAHDRLISNIRSVSPPERCFCLTAKGCLDVHEKNTSNQKSKRALALHFTSAFRSFASLGFPQKSRHSSCLFTQATHKPPLIMFNANFSFSPSTSSRSYTSVPRSSPSNVSPNTSRSPSPHQSQGLDRSRYYSQRLPQRDSRYDTYRGRQPSVAHITTQLQSYTISVDCTSSPAFSDAGVTTPSDMDTEGSGFDGPDTPASTATDYSFQEELDPAMWDMPIADLHPTSSPRPSLSLEAQALSSFTQRRRQRQALVRLQCLATRAPDLALLLEECHPSSLPLDPANRRNSSTTSTPVMGSSRVDKERASLARKAPRSRRRTTKT